MAATVSAAPSDLFRTPGPDLDEAADRHFAPDGRFRRSEETAPMLEGAEADRNLGGAR